MMDWSNIETVKVLYRLLAVKGMGPVRANNLLSNLRNKVASTEKLQENICACLNEAQKETFLKDLKLDIDIEDSTFLSIFDDKYPKEILQDMGIASPTVLSLAGNLDLLNKHKIGFSGSRKVSEKGMAIAEDVASQLADNDFCLVSGYANGVDMVAHKTALERGASTIIVLPEGISSFYIKKELKSVWDWNRILVVSEFEPFAKWQVSRAMQRNRTIIALSQAMLVIEAGEKGGSLDAGLKSIEKGKKLFVPQYADFPVSALGNKRLLQNGAYPLKMSRTSMKANLDNLYASVGAMQPAMTLF